MLDLLTGTIDLSEKLATLFEKVKHKITGNEKEAADNLQKVSDEIMKFFVATQEEVSAFQSLDFTSNLNNSTARKVLFDLQSGMLQVRIAEASGSCQKINSIYQQHLKRWFMDIFHEDSDDYKETEFIFQQLTGYDLSMLEATKELERYLIPKAESMLEMLDAGDPSLSSLHNDVSTELLATRIRLSQIIKTFIELRNSFAQIIGTI
jgi:hypothetical protein